VAGVFLFKCKYLGISYIYNPAIFKILLEKSIIRVNLRAIFDNKMPCGAAAHLILEG